MTAAQFMRLADRLESLPPDVKRIAAAMAENRPDDAAAIAGGKGSPDWWTAEFFLTSLAEHGVTLPPARKSAAAAPRAPALFAD